VQEISLKLTERTAVGKKAAKLRKEGVIPSVVYGGKSKAVATQSPRMETTKVARVAGKHTPVHLTIDGKKKLAIIKNIDIDPVKHSVRHIAFHTVKQNEAIVTEVPIVLTGTGESAAEKAGLVILQAIEKVEIKAKPADLPEALEISVAGLSTDEDKLTLADLTLPENVVFADADQDMDLVIANVYEPGALQAANEAAAGEAESEAEVTAENGEEEVAEAAEDTAAPKE
jgi:large subunit ribosomal protein L25